jgi:hypothetical protein
MGGVVPAWRCLLYSGRDRVALVGYYVGGGGEQLVAHRNNGEDGGIQQGARGEGQSRCRTLGGRDWHIFICIQRRQTHLSRCLEC